MKHKGTIAYRFYMDSTLKLKTEELTKMLEMLFNVENNSILGIFDMFPQTTKLRK